MLLPHASVDPAGPVGVQVELAGRMQPLLPTSIAARSVTYNRPHNLGNHYIFAHITGFSLIMTDSAAGLPAVRLTASAH